MDKKFNGFQPVYIDEDGVEYVCRIRDVCYVNSIAHYDYIYIIGIKGNIDFMNKNLKSSIDRNIKKMLLHSLAHNSDLWNTSTCYLLIYDFKHRTPYIVPGKICRYESCFVIAFTHDNIDYTASKLVNILFVNREKTIQLGCLSAM